MTRPLVSDADLERSAVVANCRMNRERDLAGANGYDRELRLHPAEWLRDRAKIQEHVRWLDLCCGTGKALVQAAEFLTRSGLAGRFHLVGVDLVDLFAPHAAAEAVRLIAASVHCWEPAESFDLITCVHGLHYLGDKLEVIARSLRWLAKDGLFLAHLDAANLRRDDGRPLARSLSRLFRSFEILYDRRKKLLCCSGPRVIRFPVMYLGSDPTAGPNYTGQPAVHSYYRRLS